MGVSAFGASDMIGLDFRWRFAIPCRGGSPLLGNLSVFQPGSPPLSETIEQLFRATAKREAARDAVSDGHASLTYGDILAAADRGAHRLSQAGLKDSEPVVVPVSNIAADIPAFLAVWRAGGVVVPVHRTTPKAAVGALTARLGSRFALDGDVETLSPEAPPRQLRSLTVSPPTLFERCPKKHSDHADYRVDPLHPAGLLCRCHGIEHRDAVRSHAEVRRCVRQGS